MENFGDVPLQVDAGLPLRPMRLNQILGLRPGDVLATSVPASARVSVYAGGARIGAGDLSNSAARPTVRMVEFGSER